MDWETYKELSHSPPYFTRWALDRTATHLTGTAFDRLEQCKSQQALEKPTDHKGGPETDVIRLELSGECVHTIIEALQEARVQVKLNKGSAQPNLGTLIKSWEEYQKWLSDESS